MSNAIDGTNHAQGRPFEKAYTTASTTEVAIVSGSYVITCTTDAVLRIGLTGMGAAAALGTTQPAAGAEYSIRFFANQPQAVDLNGSGLFFRVIGLTVAGSIVFQGPIGASQNP